MSGLPRSGSTLLTALLNQNPEIHASTKIRRFDFSTENVSLPGNNLPGEARSGMSTGSVNADYS